MNWGEVHGKRYTAKKDFCRGVEIPPSKKEKGVCKKRVRRRREEGKRMGSKLVCPSRTSKKRKKKKTEGFKKKGVWSAAGGGLAGTGVEKKERNHSAEKKRKLS